MLILSLIAMLDGIGFGIILPLLPIFAIKYDINTFDIAIIAAIYSFFQLICSPFLGMISDRFGRKKIIIVSLLIISYSYYLFGNATTFLGALIARAIAGAFAGNISVILASVTDLSNNTNRYKYMGIISSAYGLGFILGPIIAGLLSGDDISHANLHSVFNWSAIISLLAALISIIYLKETLDYKSNITINLNTRIQRTFAIILYNRQLMFFIVLTILMWFAFSSLSVYMNLWVISYFDLSPKSLGVFISLFGFTTAFVMFFSVWIVNGIKAIFLGFFLSTIAILLLILSIKLQIIITIIIMLAIGMGVLYPNLNSVVSLHGSKKQKGFVLGLSQSAGMLGQTAGPLITGFFYYKYNPNAAWIVIFSCFLISVMLILFYMKGRKKVV